MSTLDGRDARRARVAVSALFLVNGALIANVLPRLPAIKTDLGLTNVALGTAIAAMLAGARACALLATTSGGIAMNERGQGPSLHPGHRSVQLHGRTATGGGALDQTTFRPGPRHAARGREDP